jgi:hypothetical protein
MGRQLVNSLFSFEISDPGESSGTDSIIVSRSSLFARIDRLPVNQPKPMEPMKTITHVYNLCIQYSGSIDYGENLASKYYT